MSLDHLNLCTFCYLISPCILFALATTCRCANSILNADQRTKLFLNLWIHCSSKIELSRKTRPFLVMKDISILVMVDNVYKGLSLSFFYWIVMEWWLFYFENCGSSLLTCLLHLWVSDTLVQSFNHGLSNRRSQALKSLFVKAALNFALACLWLYFQLPYYLAELFSTLGDKIESLSVHST